MYDGISAEWWIGGLAAYDAVNERHMLALLALTGLPDTYLDVGSGTGAMVNLARKLGVDAWGVDQLPRVDKWLLPRDLREPLNLGRRFDLVTCIEVAEHLPEPSAGILCDSLARHVEGGGILVFSASLPGQAGAGHIHNASPHYWRTLLYDRGLSYSSGLTLKASLVWTWMHTPLGHLAANLQVFTMGTPNLPSGVVP